MDYSSTAAANRDLYWLDIGLVLHTKLLIFYRACTQNLSIRHPSQRCFNLLDFGDSRGHNSGTNFTIDKVFLGHDKKLYDFPFHNVNYLNGLCSCASKDSSGSNGL